MYKFPPVDTTGRRIWDLISKQSEKKRPKPKEKKSGCRIDPIDTTGMRISEETHRTKGW